MRIHILPFRFPDLIDENADQFEEGEDLVGMRSLSSDHNIFKTFGFEIVDGKDFSTLSPDEAGKSFVLNEAAVKELGLENPVGKRIEYIWGQEEPLKGHIIGVVKDFHYASLHTEVEPLVSFVNTNFNRYLSVRLQTGDLQGSIAFLKDSLAKVFPNTPFEHFFLDAKYDNQYRTENNMASIVLFFTILAIFIACLDLFGLLSYITEQRSKEIGIRKVLGASISTIIKTLSMEFVILVLIANVLAWLPAWYYLNQWLDGYTFRIGLSWWLFLSAGIISMLINLFIVGFQSYRAGQKNPVQAIMSQ